MSIFGQVWLWSAAAFLVGVLLTWVFLVRPAQARSRALERRLLAARTQPKTTDSAAPERRPTRTLAREERPAPVAAEPAHEPEPVWHERDISGLRHPDSIPSVPEPEPAPAFRPQETSMFTPAEAPERQDVDESLTVDEPAAQNREPERGSLFNPSYEPPAEPSPSYAFTEEPAPPAPDEHDEETTHVLPRRQRRTSPRGGFEPPQPIQPSMRPIERREPLVSADGGRSGSLFEPVVRPNSGGAHSAPEPPPARSHAAAAAVPPGPFGPGSAMPMPGGASPSEEFTVKASVTALRYCTDDSPQFPRMVAEVWFRSAADAERVGFRPLT